jgi:predicted esterase
VELGDDRTALLAPQAASQSWYPNTFLAPVEQNQPWLDSALAQVKTVFDLCAAAGLGAERIVLAGFSQGACLATEFVAQNPTSYRALFAFTGGLIGPPGADLHHSGSLSGSHVLFSSGDPDPHVPFARVKASARELERMDALVEVLRHPGRPHTILSQEIDAARTLLRAVQHNNPI